MGTIVEGNRADSEVGGGPYLVTETYDFGGSIYFKFDPFNPRHAIIPSGVKVVNVQTLNLSTILLTLMEELYLHFYISIDLCECNLSKNLASSGGAMMTQVRVLT